MLEPKYKVEGSSIYFDIVKQICIAFVDVVLKNGDINTYIYIYIYIYMCMCSVRGFRTHGVLWNIFQSDFVLNEEAPPGHRHRFQQCHQLGGKCLDHSDLGCLRRRRSSRPLLDVCHCLHYLYLCTSQPLSYLISHPHIFQLCSSLIYPFYPIYNTIDIYVCVTLSSQTETLTLALDV
jgi:hypothetical protein